MKITFATDVVYYNNVKSQLFRYIKNSFRLGLIYNIKIYFHSAQILVQKFKKYFRSCVIY